MLIKVISGGQTGVDEAALRIAKLYGLQTGGWMPPGWITTDGPKPYFADDYGMQEHIELGYKPRTWANVRDSDATVRIASNFKSPGEICTYNAIKHYQRLFYDIHVDIDIFEEAKFKTLCMSLAGWLQDKNVQILNVAGNSARTNKLIFDVATQVLRGTFEELGLKGTD